MNRKRNKVTLTTLSVSLVALLARQAAFADGVDPEHDSAASKAERRVTVSRRVRTGRFLWSLLPVVPRTTTRVDLG